MYETNYKIYLLHDLLVGGDFLKEFFANGKSEEQTVKLYVKQMFLSISYLSSLGIMHRDIKPENLMLKDKHSQ